MLRFRVSFRFATTRSAADRLRDDQPAGGDERAPLEAHLELKEIWEDFRDDPEVWVAILPGRASARSRRQRPEGDAERTAAGTDVQGRERPPFGRITRDFDCRSR
jgi:hypothetical protein